MFSCRCPEAAAWLQAHDLDDEGLCLLRRVLVREDAHVLYGFLREHDRALFRNLLKVSGVGAKIALAILSGISVEGFSHCVRAEDINYMAMHGRGLICLTMSRERCKQLRLPLMVSETDQHHATNFTISIEAAEGITTGISAYDRAHTIRTAVRPDATPADLTQPGHVFPLMCNPGGVLARAGHTEASVDLAMLAGLEPAAVLVEILNVDGSMARRPELERFARDHECSRFRGCLKQSALRARSLDCGRSRCCS